MKRFVFLVLLALTWGKIVASDYLFLNIEQTNGTITTLESTGLTITFTDGKMIASQNGSSTTFSLIDLNKMYFGTTNGVKLLESENEKSFTVYNISGIKIGEFENSSDINNKLNKGIYIVEKGGKSYKLSVK